MVPKRSTRQSDCDAGRDTPPTKQRTVAFIPSQDPTPIPGQRVPTNNSTRFFRVPVRHPLRSTSVCVQRLQGAIAGVRKTCPKLPLNNGCASGIFITRISPLSSASSQLGFQVAVRCNSTTVFAAVSPFQTTRKTALERKYRYCSSRTNPRGLEPPSSPSGRWFMIQHDDRPSDPARGETRLCTNQ